MRHLSEEEQILAYYGEPVDDEARSHLDDCADCQQQRIALGHDLDSLEDSVPEPDGDYEGKIWNRLRQQIEAAPIASEKVVPLMRRDVSRFKYWLAAAAAAIFLVAIGFFAGRNAGPENPTSVASNPAAAKPAVEPNGDSMMTPAVSDQVDRSERLLTELTNLNPQESDLTDESLAAEKLLASNRIYRSVAREAGATEVASLLDDIEPILLELAHSGSDLSASDLEELQKRIERGALVLKLRVLSSTLKTRNATQPPPAPGAARL